MESEPKSKSHHKRVAGPKADKKKFKKGNIGEGSNAKAFTYKSAVKAARVVRRNLDRDSKRQRVPTVDRTPLEPPPMCVALVGPPKVGKTLLLQCLLKNYTRQNISNLRGPITVVSGKFGQLSLVRIDVCMVFIEGNISMEGQCWAIFKEASFIFTFLPRMISIQEYGQAGIYLKNTIQGPNLISV